MGKIRDSNRVTLVSALQQHGFQVFDLGIAKDSYVSFFLSLLSLPQFSSLVSFNRQSFVLSELLFNAHSTMYFSFDVRYQSLFCRTTPLLKQLQDSLETVDVIVTSGGVSMGEKVRTQRNNNKKTRTKRIRKRTKFVSHFSNLSLTNSPLNCRI